MAGFDGTGIYVIRYNFVQDAAAGVKILASKQDQMWTDVAGGFNNCITRDGQGKPTSDIDWNGHKITGLGPATLETDVPQLKQVKSASAKSPVNAVQNACFSVWQRGAPITPDAAGAFTADRWFLRRHTGSGAGLHATQNAGDAGNPFFTSIGFGRVSGDTGNAAWAVLTQNVETINARKLIDYQNNTSGIVTVVSMYLRKGTSLPDCLAVLSLQTADLADASAYGAATWETDAELTVNTATLSATVYTRVSFVVSAAAFKNSSSMMLSILLGNDEATAGADSLLYVTGAKIEQLSGTATSSPTAFEPLDYTLDLLRCQRYYQVLGGASNAILFSGYATNAGAAHWDHTIVLPVSMFDTPTAVVSGTWALTNTTAPTVVTSGPSSIVIRAAPQSPAYTSFATNSTDDTITLAAELTA